MAGKVSTLRLRQLFTRRCVACGTPVDSSTPHCEECGCDFDERPPRSYAEMEGLVGSPLHHDLDRDERPHDAHARPARLIERWLLFIFLSLMMLVAIAMLASAAIQPAR